MASAQPPAINKGERIPFTSRPFLGNKRVNKVIAICNALNNLDVQVISVASTGNAALDAQTATTGGLVMDSQGHATLGLITHIAPDLESAKVKAKTLFDTLNLPKNPDGLRISDQDGQEMFFWTPATGDC